MSDDRCPACSAPYQRGRALSVHIARSHPDEQVALVLAAYIVPGEPDACWAWLGAHSGPGGYAITQVNGRQERVSRLLIAAPAGLDACHSCDNPPCVNRAHIWAGTRAENQHDKRDKGRAARGEANRGGGGKLTEAAVRQIRAEHAAGVSMKTLGLRFGVTGTMIGHIVRRTQWRHVA